MTARNERAPSGDHWKPVGKNLAEGALSELCQAHGLPNDDSLLKLISDCRERATREQAHLWSSSGFMTDRRDAREALSAIIGQGTVVNAALDQLHRLIREFEETYEYEPNLMQAIADVGPGTAWFAADELHCLSALRGLTGRESAILEQLRTLNTLKVRPKRKRGRVPNLTVRKCVQDCHDYWVAQGRTWKIESLEDEALRLENDDSVLTGRCEQFVCDLLRVAGVEHTLTELSAAMGRL